MVCCAGIILLSVRSIHMSNKHPFRHMRLTMQLAQAQVALLLGVQGISWEKAEYAMFYVLQNMVKQYDNPTYKQYIVGLAAWLRFYKRLVAKLPAEARDKVQIEFDKLTADYQDLLEVQPSKQ